MHIFILWILTIFMLNTNEEPDLKSEQLGYSRVANAYTSHLNKVKAYLTSKDIETDSFDIYIRAFKFEEELEVWAKNRDSSTFSLITTYKFCSNVGLLGPKRRQGDLQIPEGSYVLSKFNPESNFHLSLKVNYPNKADSILGYKPQLGGLIFIHGGCHTIGCIPITDEKIKELYILCLEAKTSGQEDIPIHIFPAKLSAENMLMMKEGMDHPKLITFWESLKPAYDLFEQHRMVPETIIDDTGNYHFKL